MRPAIEQDLSLRSPIAKHNLRIMRATEQYKTLSERLDNLTIGEGFQHMGDLPKGEWVESEPGVMTRMIFAPGELQLLTGRITILESRADKRTERVRVHSHHTEDIKSNQVIFVEEGLIKASIHDGPGGAVVYSSVYGKGSMVTFTPDQWHSVQFEKGARVISIFFPAI